MLAHKFVEQSVGSDLYLRKQQTKKSWWSFGWWNHLPFSLCFYCPTSWYLCIFSYKCWLPYNCRTSEPVKDENEPGTLTEEDWERLNDIIGYKEGDDKQVSIHDKGDKPHMLLKLHMRHNASKLVDSQGCLADLSCDNLDCGIKLYSEAKVVNIKLGSYRLLSPNGLLAEVGITSLSNPVFFCVSVF